MALILEKDTVRRKAASLLLPGLLLLSAMVPFRGEASPPEAGRKFGASVPFSWEGLREKARLRAAGEYVPPAQPAPDIVARINYEVQTKIRFRPDQSLFRNGPGQFPAQFFHLGEFFRKTVRIFEVDGAGAREILYSPDYFDMPSNSIARKLPPEAGFAGFRFQEDRQQTERPWQGNDWVAFAGASYFRAIGELYQYGLSARGVAVNTADVGPEEFPDFVELYLEPGPEPDRVFVYALLEGPSLSGVYRFAMQRGRGVVMEIDASLFLRKDVNRLGIAPLTSMFWFAEYGKPRDFDWRPEVHDSDGLAVWNGSGERLWRPLNNPPRVVTSVFVDDNPRGFGLLQRDRNRDHYRDGVLYERRPSLWVEPLGGWGKGSVQLVEIPTDDEIHDNIVAMWIPAEPARAGNRYELSYRLHWLADEPYFTEALARTVATRIGRGGEPGKPRPKGVRKFVIEFRGKALETLAEGTKVEAVVSSSRGEISHVFAEPIPGETDLWRGHFDLKATGSDPVELRLFLKTKKGAPLTETWLYQHWPADADK